MIHVIPIAKTDVDWNAYLQIARKVLGRSITRSLDSANRPVKGPDGFIATLGEVINEGSNAGTVMANAGSLLRHFTYTFLCVMPNDVLWDVMEETDLVITSVPLGMNRLAIITGTLHEWRTAIIDECSEAATQGLRLFLNQVLFHLEKEGLNTIWFMYRKVPQPDQTFALEHK